MNLFGALLIGVGAVILAMLAIGALIWSVTKR